MKYQPKCRLTWFLYRKWIHVYMSKIYFPLRNSIYRNGYKLFLNLKGSKVVEYPLHIVPFEYNGFMGVSFDHLPPVMGKYLQQTNDPGVVLIELEGGEIKPVPTYAILNNYTLPKLKWDHCFKEGSESKLFGYPSSLKGEES